MPGDAVTGLATGLDAAVVLPLCRSASYAMVDAALVDRAQSALDSNPHVPARRVQLEANEGRLILKGAVRTFFQKQMAQEALRLIEGTHEIDNQLEVHWA